MAQMRFRPGDVALVDALPGELKAQMLEDFRQGRLSTSMMCDRLRKDGHDIKRQDLWIWLNQELNYGTS